MFPLFVTTTVTNGCDGAAETPQPFTLSAAVRRDSAGIQIVENDQPLWSDGKSWVVEPTPYLAIGQSGASSADYYFVRVLSAFRRTNGSVAVVDQIRGLISFFDSTGHFIFSVGRYGAGPGEFKHIRSAHWVENDRIAVWDEASLRVTLTGSDGAFVSMISLPGIAALRDVFRDGGLLIQSRAAASPAQLAHTDADRSMPLDDFTNATPPQPPRSADARLQRDSVTMGYIDANDVRRISLLRNHPIGVRALPVGQMQPLSPRLHIAVERDVYFAAFSSEYRVDKIDRSGRILASWRRLFTPIRVTSGDISALLDSHLRVYKAWDEPAQYGETPLRSMIEANQVATTHPVFSDLMVSRDGYVWVQRYGGVADRFLTDGEFKPEPARTWDVFDSSGIWLGAVDTPHNLAVLEIGADYVLGRSVDSLDVQSVRLHKMVKPPR
jgi:hypothetical protein